MKHSPKREGDGARTSSRSSSRRRFLKLLAAGSVAAATTAIPEARATTRKRAPARPLSPKETLPSKIAKEIDNQKACVGRTLDTIRRYPLPPGTEPAFVFQPFDSPRNRPKSGDGGSSR